MKRFLVGLVMFVLVLGAMISPVSQSAKAEPSYTYWDPPSENWRFVYYNNMIAYCPRDEVDPNTCALDVYGNKMLYYLYAVDPGPNAQFAEVKICSWAFTQHLWNCWSEMLWTYGQWYKADFTSPALYWSQYFIGVDPGSKYWTQSRTFLMYPFMQHLAILPGDGDGTP